MGACRSAEGRRVNVGAWDPHYRHLTEPEPYGGTLSYELIAEEVRGLPRVEDWGCGKGWLRRYIDPNAYVGVDGSCTPFADVICDLTEYRSRAAAVVLRHVLEHNYEWAQVLDNALGSFTDKLVIVLFTPLVAQTYVMHTEPDYADVPCIAFRLDDLVDRIPTVCTYRAETFESEGHPYGEETLIVVTR